LDQAAVVMTDHNGIIVYWSLRAADAFGFSASQAVGRTLDLIVPPEFQQDHWHGFRRAMRAGEAAAEGQVSTFPVRLAGGEIVATQGRLSLIRRAAGDVIGALVAFETLVE
jgi:PAS domain S-box-containing protein